ncbi:MAG: hypothetical protein JJU18_04485 [Oceanicaulis sp.]|nr:hypothetical protein [Oceanicaulis sp.]
MNTTLLTSLAALSLTLGAASGAGAAAYGADEHGASASGEHAHGGARRGMRGLMMLTAAAGDRDADLARDDFAAFLAAEFDFRDTNNDGVLNAEDASPARRAMMELRADSPRAQAWRERRGADAGPREVTREDFIARGLDQFDRVDANNDGVVTAEERRAVAEQARERMRERRGDGERRGRGWRRNQGG